MLKKKWMIIILVILLFLIAGIYLVTKTGALSRHFKDLASEKLEKLLARKVSIENIDTNFFNRITLGGIRVAQGSDFSQGDFVIIDKLSINLNLLRFITRPSELVNTIKRMDIIKPVIFVNNKKGDWNIALPTSAGGELPLKCQIYIYRGQVIIEDVSGKFDKLKLTALNGLINLSDPVKKQAEFTARTNLSDDDEISVKINLAKDIFNADLALERASLANYTKFIKLFDDYKFTSGLVDLNISMTGNIQYPANAAYQGKAVVKGATVEVKGVKEGLSDINGELTVTNRILSSPEISAKLGKYSFRVKGDILDFESSNPSFNLKLDFPLVDCGSLMDLADAITGMGKIDISGIGSFKGGITGTLDKPIATGEIKITNGQVLNDRVSNLETKFQYKDGFLNLFSLSTEFYKGKLLANGLVNFNPTVNTLNFDLKCEKVALVDYLNLGENQKDIKGQISLTGKLGGDVDWPLLEGEASFSNLSVRNFALPALAGKLKYYKDQLSVTAQTPDLKYNIDTTVNIHDDAISVKKFVVGWNKSTITSLGKIDLKHKNIALDIRTSGLKAEDFTFIEQYYKNLTGKFSFGGQLKGRLNDLLIKGEINSEDLLLNQQKISLMAAFSFNGRNLKVSTLKINKSYQASGGLIFSEKADSPYLDIEASVQEGQLEMLPVLLKMGWLEGNIEGVINGNLKLKGPLEDLTGGGEIQLTGASVLNNKIDKLDSSFAVYSNELHIGKFIIQENGGKLKGTAEIGLRSKMSNNFNLTLNVEKFKFQEVLFDGDINLVGKLNYGVQKETEASLITSGFRINNEPQDIKTKLNYRNKILYIAPVSPKDNYALTGQIDFNQEPRIDAVLTVKNATLEHFLKFTRNSGFKGLGGNLEAEIKFKGLVKNPELNGKLDITDGNFRTFKFDELKAVVAVKDKVLVLKEVKGKAKNGDFSVKGKIDFSNKSKQLNMTVDINQLELRPLIIALLPQLKENIEGSLDGTLVIGNNLDLPTVEGNLTLNDVTFDIYQVKVITTDFSFSNNTVKISSLKAENSGRVVKISEGSNIKIVSDGVLSFDLLIGIRNVTFSGLSVFGGIYLTGNIDSTGPSSKVSADLVTDDLWVNQHKFDKAKLKLLYNSSGLEFLPVPKSRTQLLGKIILKEKGVYYFDKVYLLENNRESLTVKGYLRTEEDRLKVRFNAVNFDAGAAGELAGLKFPITGKTTFEGEIWGQITNPQFTINLNIKTGSFSRFKFDELNLVASAKDGMINLQKFTIYLKDKLNIAGQGDIPFAFSKKGEEKINGRQINLTMVVFESDLSVLTNLSSQIKKASGAIEAKLDVKGPLDNPLLSGYIKVDKGKISAKQIIKETTDMAVDIIIVKNQMTVNRLSGKIGEGYINITGGAQIDNYSFKEYDIEMATSQNVGIDLSMVGFIPKGAPIMKVHMYGNEKEHHIDGNIRLVNTHFTYPPQSANNEGGDIFETDFFKNAIWDLDISAGDNTWYENNLVTANITGGLQLKGQQENFKLTGKVESRRGEVSYLGVDFKILETILNFQDSMAYLEGKAESKLEDDLITLVVEKSKLKDIKPKFYSQENPQMSQEKVIALLFYGKDVGKVPKENLDKVLLTEMLKLVDTNLSSRVIRPILKEAGLDTLVDVVKVKTMVLQKSNTSPEQSPFEGSQVTFGKYFTSNIYVSYTTFLKTGLENRLELKHRIELEYRIQGNKFLKMRMDDTEKFMGLENQINF